MPEYKAFSIYMDIGYGIIDKRIKKMSADSDIKIEDFKNHRGVNFIVSYWDPDENYEKKIEAITYIYPEKFIYRVSLNRAVVKEYSKLDKAIKKYNSI